jgi:FixJ family two-component response regulator
MPLRVVYIDDEVALCENFQDLHSSPEVEIETFTSPELAIESIRNNPPDLLFLDYRLPGTTGDQVASVLNLSKPIILITGELEVKTTYPFHMIIQKSADISEISSVIEFFRQFKSTQAA